MALTADQTKAVAARVVADWLDDIGPLTIDKPALKAAIAAADTWLDAAAASFNNALPQPFRGEATAALKSALLRYVAEEKYG